MSVTTRDIYTAFETAWRTGKLELDAKCTLHVVEHSVELENESRARSIGKYCGAVASESRISEQHERLYVSVAARCLYPVVVFDIPFLEKRKVNTNFLLGDWIREHTNFALKCTRT